MKQCWIYKKVKKELVPVECEDSNNLALKKLNELYESRNDLKIPSKYIKNWNEVALYQPNGIVEKANSIIIKSESSAFALNNTLNDLTAKEWLPETVTVFAQKGLGATNKDAKIEKQHPAPFSFLDVSRLIQFYTKEYQSVLDPFSGVASTVKACAYTNRYGTGVELNQKYHDLGLERIDLEVPDEFELKNNQKLINSNSINQIKKFKKDSFDFIVTSPPYWNILDTVDHKSAARIEDNLDHKYSENNEDLANIDSYQEFLKVLSNFFNNCSRPLKAKKYMCVIVSDFRKKEKYYTFHADLANQIEKKNKFVLKGIRILYQRHKSIFPYGYPSSFVPNMHHQNVLIFQNIKDK